MREAVDRKGELITEDTIYGGSAHRKALPVVLWPRAFPYGIKRGMRG